MKCKIISLVCTVLATVPLQGKEWYSTADTLLIRKAPSRQSAIIGMVPYGSKLIDNAAPPVDADGLQWIFSTNAGGFVAAGFLSAEQPAKGLKHLELKAEGSYIECKSDGSMYNESFILESGEFIYKGGGMNVSYSARHQGRGTYAIIPGGIQITFTEMFSHTEFSGIQSKDGPPKPRKINLIRSLMYSTQLIGFRLNAGDPEDKYSYFLRSLKTTSTLNFQDLDLEKCQFRTKGCAQSVEGFLCNR